MSEKDFLPHRACYVCNELFFSRNMLTHDGQWFCGRKHIRQYQQEGTKSEKDIADAGDDMLGLMGLGNDAHPPYTS